MVGDVPRPPGQLRPTRRPVATRGSCGREPSIASRKGPRPGARRRLDRANVAVTSPANHACRTAWYAPRRRREPCASSPWRRPRPPAMDDVDGPSIGKSWITVAGTRSTPGEQPASRQSASGRVRAATLAPSRPSPRTASSGPATAGQRRPSSPPPGACEISSTRSAQARRGTPPASAKPIGRHGRPRFPSTGRSSRAGAAPPRPSGASADAARLTRERAAVPVVAGCPRSIRATTRCRPSAARPRARRMSRNRDLRRLR